MKLSTAQRIMKRNSNVQSGMKQVRIGSYNINGLRRLEDVKYTKEKVEFKEYVKIQDCDIICLQVPYYFFI